MAARNPLTRAQAALRKIALAYPEATEDHPWGESAFKVRGKVFVFLSLHDGKLRATTKLPSSGRYALTQPFASPTGYGLGKSGWVTCTFAPGDAVPLDLLEDWVGESFRAVAPKKLVAAMDRPSG
jgi:predicted DNA-binding protein (MmcQ/YjbR family)